MKKIFGIFITLVFILQIPISVYAAEPITNQSVSGDDLRILVDKEIKDISYDEFVRISAAANGVSETEFILNDSKNLTRSNSFSYKQVTYTYKYSKNSNFSFSIIAVFRIEGYGNYYEIVSCSTVYTKAATGTDTYSWTQGAAQCESLTASQALILGSGYFQVEKNDNSGIEGFGLSHSIGNIYYYTSDAITKTATVTIEELKYAPGA